VEPAAATTGYLIVVKHEFVLGVAVLVTLAVCACGGNNTSVGAATEDGGRGAVADDAGYETAFQGDGVQCGGIICSGAQLCCLVYVPTDASNSNPTHACDQDCVSVCADTCPDAGGMTSAGMPPGVGMPPAGGMPPGGGMPLAGGGGGMPGGGVAPGGGMPPSTMGPGGSADAATN
jgi:hypothetical protein